MMIALKGSQRGLHSFFILAISVLCFIVYHHSYVFSPTKGFERITTISKDSTNGVVKRVAVPFGHDQPYNFSSPVQGSTTHSPARIRKRALSFFDAICKGEKHFLNIARAAFAGSTTAHTYSVQEIEEAGWTIGGDFMLNIPDAMKPALNAFNIRADADSNKIRYATQDKSYTGIGGNQEESTQGQYYQLYNPSGKAIICPDNAAPGYFLNGMREMRGLPELPEGSSDFRNALPKINRWSDVVWGIWSDTAGGAAGSLQYIFRDNIVTEDTRSVIDEAIAPTTIGELAWPGKTFSQDELSGQALMGTPHGNGIAWMLIEHIDVLGKRDIEITVYSGPGSGARPFYYYMVFNMKPSGS